MARIARLSGAPMAKGAGVDLFCKHGAEVECSTPLYRIYAEYPSEFEFACACAELDCGFRIAAPGVEELQRDLHEK
jgi:thymidine phosphorylase